MGLELRVRPGSSLEKLGLRSGDVLTHVNGAALDSPHRALALYGQLSSARELRGTFLRDGVVFERVLILE